MILKTRIFLSIFLSSFVMLLVIGTLFLYDFRLSTYTLLEEYNITTSQFAQRMIYYTLQNDGNIDMDEIEGLTEELSFIQFGKDGYVYVMDYEGNLIIHPEHVGLNVSNTDFGKEMLLNKEGSIRYTFEELPFPEREKQVYYRDIPELEWIVAAGPYLDEVRDKVETALIYFCLSLLLVLLVNVFVAVRLTRIIYSPIRKGSEQIYMLVHRIDSDKLKSQIHKQINRITGYDEALDKTLNTIKKVTKKHS